jgi:hypothetical protein
MLKIQFPDLLVYFCYQVAARDALVLLPLKAMMVGGLFVSRGREQVAQGSGLLARSPLVPDVVPSASLSCPIVLSLQWLK